jgi:hypothetical protein
MQRMVDAAAIGSASLKLHIMRRDVAGVASMALARAVEKDGLPSTRGHLTNRIRKSA